MKVWPALIVIGLLIGVGGPALEAQAEKLIKTKSGLQYADIREGKGAAAEKGRRVRVLYTGKLKDGTTFDSRTDRNRPFDFTLGIGAVIKGWDEGIVGMKVGGIRKLVVPASLAYAAKGFPGKVPPNAELSFEIELLGVSRGPAPATKK